MSAENADIEEGDTVAVWGCGPVGQFAIQSAWMFGAGRVIAIDLVPERLAMAARQGKAEVINFEKIEGGVYDKLQEMTDGRGPDRCIDAVGAEAHGAGAFDTVMDKAKAAVMLATDRAHVLREAIMCCRKGGTVSIPGGCIGFVDKVPMGSLMNKGLTIKTGQTHMKRYTQPLLDKINAGEIDPSFVITHNRSLGEGPELYKTFRDKRGRVHQGGAEAVSLTSFIMSEEKLMNRRRALAGIGASMAGVAAGPLFASQENQNSMQEKELQDPTTKYPRPPFKGQSQPWPGLASKMDPRPDHGEKSCKGSGRLAGRKALITAGTREWGAPQRSLMRARGPMWRYYYPTEEPDAQEVSALIRVEGRKRSPCRVTCGRKPSAKNL